jgi:hypothetical protein
MEGEALGGVGADAGKLFQFFDEAAIFLGYRSGCQRV